MPPKPKSTDDDDEPRTLHEMQKRRMGSDDNDTELSNNIPLPEDSPWGKVEPSIN
jgi:hypothetical protein